MAIDAQRPQVLAARDQTSHGARDHASGIRHSPPSNDASYRTIATPTSHNTSIKPSSTPSGAMDRHAYRRLSLVGSAFGLIAAGLLHPGNRWMMPPALLAMFMIAFAATSVGGVLLLTHGRGVFRPILTFLHTSTAFVVVIALVVADLVALAALSWEAMAPGEQMAIVAFGVLGLSSGFREVMYGVRPAADQARRNARFRGETA